jgi:hypothetical protein
MTDRGVLYMVWGGDDKIERALERSRKSLGTIHPELPIEVVRLHTSEPIKGLLEKARMFERSPFRQTLFLDADTVVLDRLDFGFQKAQQFGIACCVCECPWARRYGGVGGETIEYNTGVLFFSEEAKPVFETWARLAPQINSSILFLGPQGQRLVMPYNDQCSFAVAIEQSNFSPFVLPLNWNFRPQWQRSFFGPVKIWHDYTEVPAFFADMHKYYSQPGSIIQYHSAMR